MCCLAGLGWALCWKVKHAKCWGVFWAGTQGGNSWILWISQVFSTKQLEGLGVLCCAIDNSAELCVKWAHFQCKHILTSCFLFLFCFFPFFLFLPSQSPLPMEPVQRPGATSPLVYLHLFLCLSFILVLFLCLLFLSFFFCTCRSVALMPWRIFRENQNKSLF